MELLTQILDGDLLYIAVLVAAGAGAASLFLGIRYLATPRADVVQERLRRAVTHGPNLDRAFIDADDRGVSVLAPIARVAQPGDEAELGRLRAKLAHAGLRGERVLINYLAAKVLLGLGCAGAFLWFNAVRPQELLNAAFFTISSMALGYYLPTFWLMSKIKERQQELNKAIPNALDLLVTCVEAGLGIEAALNRVADELMLTSPLLARELAQTSLEIRAGASRGDAFRRLAERTGVEELRSLSAVIIQTQIFGTSIADSLRIQAESMRIRRMHRAEERGAAAGVKMTIPLVLCITPALFAVLLGPAMVQIYRQFIVGAGGG
jgi:tight adherence protein C